jgi:LCP family protein required for cell wall assembly
MAPDEQNEQEETGAEGQAPEPPESPEAEDPNLHPPTEEYRIVDEATLEQAAAQPPEVAPEPPAQEAPAEEEHEEEEDEEVEDEEHDEGEEAGEEQHYAPPLPSDGVLTPAQGGMPVGMQPPPGFIPQADEPGEKPPRPHLILRFMAAALLIIATFAAATSITILNFFSDVAGALGHRAELTGVKEQLQGVSVGEPETMLIIGSDKRYGEGDRGRSDTTILLRLDPNHNAISLLSIPRDLKVEIPGNGTAKFNAAYSYGGPRLTLKVVRQLTGLRINHVVNVDFAGFFYAINAIGCVFVDVDHRYFHSNAGLSASQQYSEINIQPGYQRLCGQNALAYVRYRHNDNDLVRSARQHDFLREARQKVGPSKLISDRKQLIHIFTRYTSSDINNPETMIQVMRLLIASRNSEIKEVHFPAKLGASYVTATPQDIQKAVRQFLGLRGSPNPRGSLSAPLAASNEPVPAYTPEPGGIKQPKKKGKKARKQKAAPKPAAGSVNLIDATTAGKQQAFYAKARLHFPIYYPTKLLGGSIYAQTPHVYAILHAIGSKKFPAYKMVMKTSFGEYYGVMGTTWRTPPILKNPSETRRIHGHTYLLYYDGDRLRLVAWRTPFGTYWLNNTLLETLSEKEMLGIATTMGATKAG